MNINIIINTLIIIAISLLLLVQPAVAPDVASDYTQDIFSNANEDINKNMQDVTWFDDEVNTKDAIQAIQPTIHNINTSEFFSSIQAAIDDSDTRKGHIIEVEDGVYYEMVKVTKSLTIRSENGSANCIVQSIKGYPLFLIMADRVNISGFTVKGATEGFSTGIYINTSYCNISNNNCLNNALGIILDRNSSSNIIICNNISLNHLTGISLWKSNNNSIFYNNISNNGLKPDSDFISGGFILSGSNNNITNNTFVNDGIYASSPDQNNVKNNIVNDKPLVYLENESDRTIVNAGQVILINCDNITVKDQDLSNTTTGVQILGTLNSTIMNNTIKSNHIHGIKICESSNISIINNSINSNKEHGIYLSFFTSDNQIIHNCINSNEIDGIHMFISSGNTISNNNISQNNDNGISSFFESNNNIINRNTISSNNQCGIQLYSECNNSLIYMNNLINNTGNVYQKESSNLWYFPLELNYTYNGSNFTGHIGNFWDDYKGNDTRNDGIGDTPYYINSDMDHYPLMERFDGYNVSEPNYNFGDNTQIHINTQEFAYGTFDVMIDIYNVSDLNSGQFDISFNSSVVNVTNVSAGDMNGFTIRNSWELIDTDTICIVFNLSDSGISGSGQLARISFETIGSRGDTSTLNISNVSLTATTGNEIIVTWFNDEITIGVPVMVNAPEVVSGIFNVTIDIENVTDLDSGQFNLSFDPDVIDVNEVYDGNIDGARIPISSWCTNDTNSICMLFNIPGITGISGSGQLATISFEIIGSQGDTSTLNISNVNLTDTTGNEIPVIWFNDEITIVVPVMVNAPEVVSGIFDVTIDIENVTDLDSGQFDLSFDPDVIDVNEVYDGNIDGARVPISSWYRHDTDSIRVLFNVPGITGISGSGQLATISFSTTGSSGDSCVLDISGGLLIDNKADKIRAIWTDDKVTV